MKSKIIKVSREEQQAEIEVEIFETFVEAVNKIGKTKAMRCLNYGYVQQTSAWAYRELGKEEKMPKEIELYIKNHPDQAAKLLQEIEED